MNLRLRVRLAAPLLVLVPLSACGGGSLSDDEAVVPESSAASTTSSDAGATTSAAGSAQSGSGSTTIAPEREQQGRVVALGEEFLLADLLALGVVPVASTATVASAGFQGLDDVDVSGIEVLPATELNLEQLAALRPELIIASPFVAEEAGTSVLEALAPLLLIPDSATAEERLRVLAAGLDREHEADGLLAELKAAREELRADVVATGESCVVSVATVYPGPSVAAWVDGTTDIPRAVEGAGCTLDPGPGISGADRNGRLFLSAEQVGLLGAGRLLLLQSELVDGEAEALAAIAADPLWRALPAVAAGEVVLLDRLGYPGVPGQVALVKDLRRALVPAA